MSAAAESAILKFFSVFEKRTYKKNDYLRTPEEMFAGVFCLQSGIVRCFTFSKYGAELTLNIFKPLSFFPVGWIVNNIKDKYAYQAMTNVTVYIAPRSKTEIFMKNHTEVLYDLLKRIYKGLDGYFLRMESLLSGDAYFKTLVSLVIHLRRFAQKEKNGQYRLNLTHAKLASFSGLTRETVTRTMKKLEGKKLIIHQGRGLLVSDVKKLEEELLFRYFK